LVIVLSFHFSYKYIKNYQWLPYKKYDNVFLGLKIVNEKHISWQFSTINLLVLIELWLLVHNKFIPINQYTDMLYGFVLFFSLFNVIAHINEKTNNKAYYFVIIILLYLFSIIYFQSATYKNICFVYKEKLMHVSYMNDKFIFLDSWHVVVNHNINEFFYIKDCDEKNIKNNQ
jgi:hypothetical protein